LKKAPQKLFAPRGWGVFNTARSGANVFWYLFFKKVTAFFLSNPTMQRRILPTPQHFRLHPKQVFKGAQIG
jgi:hypothetical protein